MTAIPITDFELDLQLRSKFEECMDHYGVGDATSSQWPNNILSNQLVVYSSGVIARQGDKIRHNVDPNELALCNRLSQEACQIMDGVAVRMGSESEDFFHPFFIVANLDEHVREAITPELIREKFGGTIFIHAKILVQSLSEPEEFWSEFLADYNDDDLEEMKAEIEKWELLIQKLNENPEIQTTAFVKIGDYSLMDLSEDEFPDGTEMPGCVYPRLVLGLTQKGSLVGLLGQIVQT
ncbi:MAG: hypothetical protein SWJ54_02480 [Cyanobacteriota bacterium]|nr:hypothetical protein [Cyanobacteriota bacterium]